ncbi:ATP synthase subunit g, mitochondrial [Ixodes scapularis]
MHHIALLRRTKERICGDCGNGTRRPAMSKAITTLTNAVIKGATPRLQTFVKYAKVEMMPPSPRELPEVMRGFGNLVSSAKSGAWRHLTVREASLNTLVGLEVIFWFFVGECIGKRSLVGYQV